jgi:hypothetical protein
MKKISVLFLAFALFLSNVRADEGMWLLPLIHKLNIDTMQAMGLELSAEDLYSINQSSLKDAIVVFGGFCTGEIISDQGLILTNHHCGYDQIQNHSTVEANYLEDGFWASSYNEEIPNPGLFVKFLVKMVDVTDAVLADVTEEMTEEERGALIAGAIDSLITKEVENTHYDADIDNFFGGNKYYMSVFETYNDVRLVGAPPSSIGKYGHDTDNWMWPRHTGDFAMFRVYAGPDGKPAEYAEDNVPLAPKHHLPVSLKGVEEDDYAMVLGYPGGTERYMTSYELDEVQTITHPNRIKIREMRQEILLADMQASEEINIKYASKYSRSTNYWKFSIGQSRGLKRLKIRDKKVGLETKFTNWVEADEARKEKYGTALTDIKEAVEERAEFKNAEQYLIEVFYTGCEITRLTLQFRELDYLLNSEPDSTDKIKAAAERIKVAAAEFYGEYSASTDKKVVRALIELYAEDVPKNHHPAIYEVINGKYKGNYDKFVNDLFAKSIFRSEEALNAFLADPSLKVLNKDLGYQMGQSWLMTYRGLAQAKNPAEMKFQRGHRKYVAGLIEMNPDKKYYPDANFTMRLTYGSVKPYKAADAVYYDYITTIEGVMEKEDPNNWEFIVSDRLKELYNAKDYGRYASNGTLPVCFISNNDITGGNSGSPVINGKGELIGLAFDGNWEAMSGDIVFETDIQRTINVDIRYVLWVVDKYAGAQNIIDELTIVE